MVKRMFDLDFPQKRLIEWWNISVLFPNLNILLKRYGLVLKRKKHHDDRVFVWIEKIERK